MAAWGWVACVAIEMLIFPVCCPGNAQGLSNACIGAGDSLREPTFPVPVFLCDDQFLVGVAAVPLAVLMDEWVSVTPDLCLFLSWIVPVLTEAVTAHST